MKAPVALAAAVFAAAAFAIPATADTLAQGHVRPDDRAGILGPGRVTGPAATIVVRPNDRAGLQGPVGSSTGAIQSFGNVRPDDRFGARGTGGPSTPPIPAPIVVRVATRGFDWNDAAIGAVAGAGLILLLLGAALLHRHARTEPRTA